MTPIFFPFTYLPTGVADLLRTCFDGMIVLQPFPGRVPAEMEALRDSGWLDVRAPLDIDEDRLQAVIEGYHRWAELNQGNRGIDTGLLRSAGKKPPFFDEATPSRIRDAIRNQGREGEGEEGASSLFPDLVFLSMAEQFDIQTQAVDREYEGLVGKEADLFYQLKGEDDGIEWPIGQSQGPGSGAPSEYMLIERIAAWRRLLVASFGGKKLPAVAVTPSRSVIDSLREGVTALEEVARLKTIAVSHPAGEDGRKWRNELTDYLRDLTGGAKPVSAPPSQPLVSACSRGRAFSMRLYAAAGVGLPELLSAASGESRPEPPAAGANPTVVLLITAGQAT